VASSVLGGFLGLELLVSRQAYFWVQHAPQALAIRDDGDPLLWDIHEWHHDLREVRIELVADRKRTRMQCSAYGWLGICSK